MDGDIRKPVKLTDVLETVQLYGRLGRSAAANDAHQFLASISGKAGPRTSAALNFKAMI
jgi:hypothetical protein